MPKPFATLPFSFDCQPSPRPAASGSKDDDQIQILDDPGDLTPNEEDDAASHDDIGPPEAPTRAALLRFRARAAATAAEKEAPGGPALVWASALVRASVAEVESGAWARGLQDAAKTPSESPDARAQAAIAVGLGPWPKPTRKKAKAAVEIPSWASLAARAGSSECSRKCEKKFERLGKTELLDEIRRRNATSVSDQVLRQSFTRAGLLALLCAAICESPAEGGAGRTRSGAGASPTIKKPSAARNRRRA